jgi:hypothetical protein
MKSNEIIILDAVYNVMKQKNKSEQALQIIGHVVAEFYANKRSMHGRGQFVVSNATLLGAPKFEEQPSGTMSTYVREL